MRITKYGHCCLLIEEGDARLLTDPGSFNEEPDAEGIDAVLITHEHQDHCDIGQLKNILGRNPGAEVITCADVAKVLEASGIPSRVIADGETLDIKGVKVQSQGKDHAVIYGDASPCQNTGYFVAERFYYPGDALHVPSGDVEILALPVAAPWMKTSEGIDYAKAVMPKVVFPVHDGFLTEAFRAGVSKRIYGGHLEPLGIEFREMRDGARMEF